MCISMKYMKLYRVHWQLDFSNQFKTRKQTFVTYTKARPQPNPIQNSQLSARIIQKNSSFCVASAETFVFWND